MLLSELNNQNEKKKKNLSFKAVTGACIGPFGELLHSFLVVQRPRSQLFLELQHGGKITPNFS